MTAEERAAAWLCSAEAVRSRAHQFLAEAEAGRLPHLEADPARLPAAADYVAAIIRRAYPALRIPHHARWRHFAAGGPDRWAALAARLGPMDAAETARVRVDLCVVSVLLDAGAGPGWRYVENGTGLALGRSEGLAVASLHAFGAGLFSGSGLAQADAEGLARMDAAALAGVFQVSENNPVAGLEGRAALLRNLAGALRARPDLFGPAARPGGLYDHLMAGQVRAPDVLAAVLDGFGPIWPGRATLGGRNLGDVWRHPAATAADASAGFVPFHKLSQWLTYSLLEVFEDAGAAVVDLDGLSGLPEYRNGGLFLDLEVLALRDPALARQALAPGHEAVVEWRALTVALLDRIAPLIRDRLGRSAADLPLSRILEGGTWAAGRAVAAERRLDGGPPLHVVSDGTVF